MWPPRDWNTVPIKGKHYLLALKTKLRFSYSSATWSETGKGIFSVFCISSDKDETSTSSNVVAIFNKNNQWVNEISGFTKHNTLRPDPIFSRLMRNYIIYHRFKQYSVIHNNKSNTHRIITDYWFRWKQKSISQSTFSDLFQRHSSKTGVPLCKRRRM